MTATTAAPETGLSGADHLLGDPHATVTLLQYGDYECTACIRIESQLRRLVAAQGRRLRFVFRHFPLLELHPHAELAAEAAEAAAAQKKFWPMHHLLFAQAHHLAPAALRGYAASIDLDMLRFDAEMADRIYTQRVQEHRRAGEHSGVQRTPSFFLNGRRVDIASGFSVLEHAVQSAR